MKTVYKRAHTISDPPETLFLQHVFAGAVSFPRIQTGTYRSLPPFSLCLFLGIASGRRRRRN